MNRQKDKIAAVTGAGSGIGRSLALELARRGARLALCDIDAAQLDATAQACRGMGAQVICDTVDVSDRAAVHDFADVVASHYGTVHYIINNAGIVTAGSVEKSDYSELDKIMAVDFWGVVHGTKAFLPHLIASGDGHVVNMSSGAGLLTGPFLGAYSAAKFAVRGITEALRQEMLLNNHPVTVSCIHPGAVKTDIVKRSDFSENAVDFISRHFDTLALTSPDRAARTILDGAERGRAKVLVGPDAYVFDLIARFFGSYYQRPVSLAAKALLAPSVRAL
ncbi:SDR family NAD(P)-dependent oxidoreductase [Mycobacteroides chelonae]|nr:hypothetical protein Chelonae_p2336 [Mycobacterium sp. QIA-37]